VVSPNAQRVVRPIRVYRDGILVYTSALEKRLGKPSYLRPSNVRGIELTRVSIMDGGKVREVPATLTIVLAKRGRIFMGRRNSMELEKIVSLLDGMGVREL